MDNEAISYPKPEEVFRAMEKYMRHNGASAGRGAYRRALEADRLIYQARRSLGWLFGVGDVSRIIFAANVTESLNLAIKGLLRDGGYVVTASMEHNAV